ncbi:OLC1v1038222C1 [Oldenlandia corymbosa var. corymbosa]|uniref:E3 ubiquitin-protein ligase RMA n=1 Tax=Oldenlandia corymbosa var. corymbosa TaxID=529605 RepID=A0AAV1D324_OLDCO|nr:OLC1v1038222C1 [Oldenlandia corymbosa var. corymbosa]
MGDENPNPMNLGSHSSITRGLSEIHYPGTDNLEAGSMDSLREELGQGRQPSDRVAADESSVNGIEIKRFDGNSQLFKSKEALVKKDDEEKGSADAALGCFDCRICLDLAKDPVVTCCGHLFCWHCIYRWLSFRSAASKECPVCKGEVLISSITPIHGRLGTNDQHPKTFTTSKIPPRPAARRVESWKEAFQRMLFSVPTEDLVRRLGRKIDLNAVHPQHFADASSQGSSEKTNLVLNWILTSKGRRGEQNYTLSPSDAVDFSPISPASNSNTAGTFSDISLIGSEFHGNPLDRNQEQELHFLAVDDDRDDEFSRIAADIHSDQTLESAAEFDSGTTRRSDNALTVPEADNENSRPFRRRRLS